MTSIGKIGISNSYLGKTSNIQDDFSAYETTKLYGGLVLGYQASSTTATTISAGTTLLNLSGQLGAITLTPSATATGQALFIRNKTGQAVKIGETSVVGVTSGSLVVYDGTNWIKVYDNSIA